MEAFIELLDVVVVPIVVVIMGFFAQSYLKQREVRHLYQKSLQEKRFQLYEELWLITKQVRQQGFKNYENLLNQLLDWYYDRAGGLFMTFTVSEEFMNVKKLVEAKQDAKDAVSTLRTAMKAGLDVYNKEEKGQPII